MTESFCHKVEADLVMQEPSSVCALLFWMCLYISTYADSPEIIFYIPGNCQVILDMAKCEVTDM